MAFDIRHLAIYLHLARASELRQRMLVRDRLLVIAGAMMGIGLLAFNALAVSRQIEASISIPVVDTGMLIVSVLAAVLFFAEPIALKKCVGLALLVAGIAVLRPA